MTLDAETAAWLRSATALDALMATARDRDELKVGKSGMPAIEVHGLRKSYGPREVLHGVDLHVRGGEVFCLLGPNGAGKTTTLEILEGFRSRSEGQARVLGIDPAGQPAALRQRIGIVLQECALPGELRVRELIDAYRSYYPAPLSTAELLATVELEAHADRLVRQLSGGQQRRVDLALALAGNPDMVFLDEPTTGFDPAARRRTWAAIRNLASLGKTVLLTTHYLDEAEQLADRIAVIADGTVLACGTPANLADRHLAPSRVSFNMVDSAYRRPPLVSPAGYHQSGDRVTITTSEPEAQLRALLNWARRRHRPLTGLAVRPPSLEDVYLDLIRLTGEQAP